MPIAPDPSEIFHRAAKEGERRLDQSLLELISTGFIAGFTIVFGLAALGIVHSVVEPRAGDVAKLPGSLAFGLALVMLVVGRSELFNENFFDPVATAIERDDSWLIGPLLRLWSVTFALNLVGGALMVLVLSVPGALPSGTGEALVTVAEEIVHREPRGVFADAIAGGALVALLSHLLAAVDGVGGRIAVAYIVGILLALGPFDHVIVTVLHVFFGMRFGADIGVGALGTTTVVVTAGNVIGGLGLVTFSHIAQVEGARSSDD
ncbi:formate/nitrite transporter [Haloterrigena turkmenica DSM 5511]|uniref:Formate/nitrite transporter n=1 Tax=Haloterrigena turkmenica (strain ATCC 51198 / DSM 5511 / JCM 9101 / NCIMB 13204 / VKM B-1734 / 4k) TaxID=543526 RepID=D2RQY8_HALTV|nr:formate/nitrite transporter family protein [Haloterrigena turkmenica]ADB60469.1 formate/nitrite transporter [Haloterrigena turkmenica DSM 5511]